VLVTGQGNRRTTIVVDPDWITQTEQTEDFTQGLAAWHVWKEVGPASGYWRDRVQGAQLLPDPEDSARQLLHIRRPDAHDPDCVSWNFPSASRGSLALRLKLCEGFGGLNISLTDRFFNPGDERAAPHSVCTLPISAEGGIDGALRLPVGRWMTLTLEWDLPQADCRVILDGRRVASIPVRSQSRHGISYVRLRSAAESLDKAGSLLQGVEFHSLERSRSQDP
jgi:hypothetical protein